MAIRLFLFAVVSALACPFQAFAQTDGDAGVAFLLARLEKGLQESNVDQFSQLTSTNAPADLQETLGSLLFLPGSTRVAVREREREALQGALPGDGYQLMLDILSEQQTIARIATIRLDVRRPRDDPAPDAWRIVGGRPVSFVEGLHRLSVSSGQIVARDVTIESQDLSLVLVDGFLFPVGSVAGPSGFVFLGRGQMQFSPAPPIEREQLRLFAGTTALTADFESAFVRMNPADYHTQVASLGLALVDADPRLLRRARAVFSDESTKTFSLDLGDLSTFPWHLVPTAGDFLAEVRTRRLGTLTYSRSMGDAEDVTLFDRAKGRDLVRYASAERPGSWGVGYDEHDLADYDVLTYDVEATIDPDEGRIDGRTRLRLRAQASPVRTLNIRLAESLRVSAVTSPEYGRLSFVRVRTRDSIVVNLPVALRRDAELTLVVSYAGVLASRGIDQDWQDPPTERPRMDVPEERNYLLSNRPYWYPQAPTSDFATAIVRITVPPGYQCVGSGDPVSVGPALDSGGRPPLTLYVFRAAEPVRYLSVLVSRFRSLGGSTIGLGDGLELSPALPSTSGQPGLRVRDRVALHVEANPRQQSRSREVSAAAVDIVRFYSSLLGEAPYPSLTVALLENVLPGGHSPAYMVMLNHPPAGSPVTWRNDPAAFIDFPEFFLAHELAHQWWGQAVGWRNYHEQWLSEGFAQYFAALYAQRRHGADTFGRMVRQFRRSALADSDQGPISLGYRLGQIRGDTRVLRAILYNKSAGVLHMLHRLVGGDVFFAAMRRLYQERTFENAGTDDVRRAFEREAGYSLERFFDRWIRESTVPRIRYRTSIGAREVAIDFEQMGEQIFDVPVTVTVTYADGRVQDTIVPLTEKVLEHRIQVDGAVRGVQVNRDSAALAEFEGA